jgi:hypothetical protein
MSESFHKPLVVALNASLFIGALVASACSEDDERPPFTPDVDRSALLPNGVDRVRDQGPGNAGGEGEGGSAQAGGAGGSSSIAPAGGSGGLGSGGNGLGGNGLGGAGDPGDGGASDSDGSIDASSG